MPSPLAISSPTPSPDLYTKPSKAPSPKMNESAQEFESMLLGQWLQASETSFATVPGSESSEDDGDDQMKSFATQQLANALTKQGGIGIASIVSKALARSTEAAVGQSAVEKNVSR